MVQWNLPRFQEAAPADFWSKSRVFYLAFLFFKDVYFSYAPLFINTSALKQAVCRIAGL
jgi:hypothetical protein